MTCEYSNVVNVTNITNENICDLIPDCRENITTSNGQRNRQKMLVTEEASVMVWGEEQIEGHVDNNVRGRYMLKLIK